VRGCYIGSLADTQGSWGNRQKIYPDLRKEVHDVILYSVTRSVMSCHVKEEML
jgi:hypothetical protein